MQLHWLRRPVLLAAFWVATLAVGVLALLPATTPMPSMGWDKANHALAFCVVGLLGLRSWPGWRSRVLLGLLTYGALIEIAQLFTATRTGDVLDWAADAVGLAIAALLAHRLVPRSS